MRLREKCRRSRTVSISRFQPASTANDSWFEERRHRFGSPRSSTLQGYRAAPCALSADCCLRSKQLQASSSFRLSDTAVVRLPVRAIGPSPNRSQISIKRSRRHCAVRKSVSSSSVRHASISTVDDAVDERKEVLPGGVDVVFQVLFCLSALS